MTGYELRVFLYIAAGGALLFLLFFVFLVLFCFFWESGGTLLDYYFWGISCFWTPHYCSVRYIGHLAVQTLENS